MRGDHSRENAPETLIGRKPGSRVQSRYTQRRRVGKNVVEVQSTGHSWDGIEEYDNPLPRWWLWTFYLTVVFAIGYVIAYPAWPMLNGATHGVLHPVRSAQNAPGTQKRQVLHRPVIVPP